MEKRRYSKRYALWKKITGQISPGDVVETTRNGRLSYKRRCRFVVTSFEVQGKRPVCLRYGYLYILNPRDIKVVGYIEGYEEKT